MLIGCLHHVRRRFRLRRAEISKNLDAGVASRTITAMINGADLLVLLAGQYFVQSPVLLVAFIGCVVALVRRSHAPRGSMWALAGFGLALVLGFIFPVVQIVSQRWLLESHRTAAHVGSVMTGIYLFENILHTVVYALLLVAVFAGRATPLPSVPPPLPQPVVSGLA